MGLGLAVVRGGGGGGGGGLGGGGGGGGRGRGRDRRCVRYGSGSRCVLVFGCWGLTGRSCLRCRNPCSCGKCACADCVWPELLSFVLEDVIEDKSASVRKEACHDRMYILTQLERMFCLVELMVT